MQSVAGILFFWSFELLVFLILLNFLLAIIVDAFSEVKDQTKEQTGELQPAHRLPSSAKCHRGRRCCVLLLAVCIHFIWPAGVVVTSLEPGQPAACGRARGALGIWMWRGLNASSPCCQRVRRIRCTIYKEGFNHQCCSPDGVHQRCHYHKGLGLSARLNGLVG